MDHDVVILCGGFGTRMGSATIELPKPMVEVGGRPLLWHIMRRYSAYGARRFVLCLGYRGDVIRAYFANGHHLRGDLTIGPDGARTQHDPDEARAWTVTLVETGYDTTTGGRLLAARRHLRTDRPALMTYGDGVADVDLSALLRRHQAMGGLATVTAMRPRSRFGVLELREDAEQTGGRVARFEEKPLLRERVSGGFFVLEPGAFDAMRADEPLEEGALTRLAEAGSLNAYLHDGFWLSVDTPRDLAELQRLHEQGVRPWLDAP